MENKPESRVVRRHFRSKLYLEDRADGEGKKIGGLASVFYDGTPDTEFQLFRGMVERIMPGAFDSALERPDDVRGLFNHDSNRLLGRTSAGTMTLSKESDGLRYLIDPPDTEGAREVVEAIRRRDLQGSSFSFVIKKEAWIEPDDDGPTIREIHDVELWDVGPVTYPAYEASTTQLRSCDVSEARDAMEAWEAQHKARMDRIAGYQARARQVSLDTRLAAVHN